MVSTSTASSSSTLNAFDESVIELDLEEQVEVSMDLTSRDVEIQNVNLTGKESCNLTETIANKNKWTEELEQEINDLKLQLQNAPPIMTKVSLKKLS